MRSGRSAAIALVMTWLGLVALARASDAPVTRDTLVYKDGDRIQGALVREEQGVIVFKSDRFGEVRVPAADGVVIKADQLMAKAAAGAKAPVAAGTAGETAATAEQAEAVEVKAAEARAEEEKASRWDRFSASQLTAKLRDFFGPWHGRLSISTEVVSDSADRNSQAFDLSLKRKWVKDEVQLTGRYDYAEADRINTTDTVRGSLLWRHEFNKRHFTQYRSTMEWNRAGKRLGVPNDYVLLQQELGVGVVFVSTATRKIRAGVSQNLFDVWNSAPEPDHTSRGAQSAFEEVELSLPWRMGLTQRGVWYPVRDQRDGWENRIELSKKLTETLNASVRHEIRRNNPDGSSQDYTRLRVLLGVDF